MHQPCVASCFMYGLPSAHGRRNPGEGACIRQYDRLVSQRQGDSGGHNTYIYIYLLCIRVYVMLIHYVCIEGAEDVQHCDVYVMAFLCFQHWCPAAVSRQTQSPTRLRFEAATAFSTSNSNWRPWLMWPTGLTLYKKVHIRPPLVIEGSIRGSGLTHGLTGRCLGVPLSSVAKMV